MTAFKPRRAAFSNFEFTQEGARSKYIQQIQVRSATFCGTLRSMLGNIICWKSIAETCGLLQHIRLKHTSMLLLATSASSWNLAFQFLSYSKHSNSVNSELLRANSEPN